MKFSSTFLLPLLCTAREKVTAALTVPLLARATQDPPGILGTMTTGRECLSVYFHAPQSLPLWKRSDNRFKSTLAKKCLYTEKRFCELLMAALQLIYVKESWATDESGSNKMICKRPHSKQQGGREPGTKSMSYCAWFCQCKNPMPACKIHHFLCSKSPQRDKQK